MKKTIATLLLFTTVLGYSQPYQSLFGDTITAWNITFSNLFGTITDSLVAKDDTIINSNTYKKVTFYYPETSQINTMFWGAIREDTVMGKAWYYSNSDTTERLIIDLSLNDGDSMLLGNDMWLTKNFYKVDSVYNFGGRKYIRFDVLIKPSEKLHFIEGIGTNAGITYQSDNTANLSPYLLCSYKDEQIEYQNLYYNGDCYFNTTGIEEKNKEEEIIIYPNPTTGKFTVSSRQGAIKKVEVYDLFGRLVLCTNKPQIDMSSFPAGLYIWRVGNARGKLVIE